MSTRYPLLTMLIQFLAIVLIGFGICFPQVLAQIEIVLAIGLIVLIGIPHGATDYLIFQYLSKPFWGTDQLFYFYRNYIALIGVYSLLWWFAPSIAFILFIALSIYHFGQSNWNYVQSISKGFRFQLFMSWGSFVLLSPILIHFEQSKEIIFQITGYQIVDLTYKWHWTIIFSTFSLSLINVIYLLSEQLIDLKQFRNEAFNLILLLAIYSYTPLLLGFAIYFVFWHSLGSVFDQIRFFKKRIQDYNWKQYILHATPLSLVALLTLASLFIFQQEMGVIVHLSTLFVFISVVTLPHMLLIDQLYEEWEHP